MSKAALLAAEADARAKYDKHTERWHPFHDPKRAAENNKLQLAWTAARDAVARADN